MPPPPSLPFDSPLRVGLGKVMAAICFETLHDARLALLGRPRAGTSDDLGGALSALYAGLLSGRLVVLESSVTDELASLSLRRVRPPVPTLSRRPAAQV